jgi:5-deoxy-glucuronate isomerase
LQIVDEPSGARGDGSGRTDEALRLHRRAASSSRSPYALEVTQEDAGWQWSSLRVVELGARSQEQLATGDEEWVVLPLSGGCRLSSASQELVLDGRADPFVSPSDFAYVPPLSEITLSSAGGGRFALAGARTGTLAGQGPGLLRRDAPATELRGAGSCSRRVVNYAMDEALRAERILVCEVVTPAGNWSSYPPHKHDEAAEGETELEEIYYFEIDGEGMAYQRLYGTADRPLDLLAEVRSGDVVLVPHGYHGPSMAAPGYDLYYLNVMAGPGERAWRATDDPAHSWVRSTWESQPVDPRLVDGVVGRR